MADISKKAVKKALKREKHLLAKQTAQPDIQLAAKSGPIAATSATTTIVNGTVTTVAELNVKLNRMEQQWVQTTTSPLPEGIQNAL
jgi:hypothetical protein